MATMIPSHKKQFKYLEEGPQRKKKRTNTTNVSMGYMNSYRNWLKNIQSSPTQSGNKSCGSMRF